MPRILLLPFSEACAREMALLAPALADCGLKPVMGLTRELSQGDFAQNPTPAIEKVLSDPAWPGPGGTARARIAQNLFPTFLRDFCLDLGLQRAHLHQARSMLKSLRPCALITGSDRKTGPTLAFIKAAREFGLPVFLLHFALSGQDWFPRRGLDSHRIEAAPHRLAKLFIKKTLPGQVYDSPAGEMLFYPPARTLALAKAKVLPPNSWMEGGGYSDWVLAAGREDAETLEGGGVPPSKIVLSGLPGHDELWKTYQARRMTKDALNAEYGLDADRPLLICAVPQYLESFLSDAGSYWERLEAQFAAMAELPVQNLLSIHPRSAPAEYQALASRLSIPIARQPLAQILPAAELYLATFSSTVVSAVLFGIPVTIFDFYGQHSDLFDNFAGTTITDSLAGMRGGLRRLLSDPAHYEAARQAQLKSAGRMAKLDGRAASRIASIIMDKCTQKTGSPGDNRI